jgi:antitoxin component YwqK of YwqJK toxin-antitoxin module
MKQLILIGLFSMAFFSCTERNSDKPFSVAITTNENGQVKDVKIIRNESDSNYIQLTFYPDGEIEKLQEFKDGKENGKHFRWRENGRLVIEGFKVNGEYDRVTREVRDDGRTGFEGKRTNTEFEGINNSFYKSGAIERSWNRVNSKDFGRSIYYHENGLVKEIGNYIDTGYVLIGKWDESGEKIE